MISTLYVCMYVYIYICVYIYIHTYIYIYIHISPLKSSDCGFISIGFHIFIRTPALSTEIHRRNVHRRHLPPSPEIARSPASVRRYSPAGRPDRAPWRQHTPSTTCDRLEKYLKIRGNSPNLWILMGIYSPLVGGCIPTPLKNMSSSIGMMRFPIYGKIKNGNQTTNQIWKAPDSICGKPHGHATGSDLLEVTTMCNGIAIMTSHITYNIQCLIVYTN